MKRYLLFCGERYYPLEGAWDFYKDYDSLDDALAAGQLHLTTDEDHWANILDSITKKVLILEHTIDR